MYKPIIGWEDTHLISDNGKVIVKERYVGGAHMSKRFLKEHTLKWNYQKGYPTVALYANGRMKRYFIHRLVYETFKERVPKGMQINHIDGVKGNNHISNLELVTPLENTQHAWRTGLSKKYLGEKCSTSKLTNNQIKTIRELFRLGKSKTQIGKMFNVHYTTIHCILKGKTWSHVK